MSDQQALSDATPGPEIDLRSNYFELFGLPVGYELDPHQLKRRHLALQRRVHPDRFAHLADSSPLQAVRYAAFVNEAFDTLSSPLQRALYLLELSGHPVDKEASITDAAFFEQQMDWREQLDTGRRHKDADTIAAVQQQARALMTQLEAGFVAALPADHAAAGDAVRKMLFIDRLLAEASQGTGPAS